MRRKLCHGCDSYINKIDLCLSQAPIMSKDKYCPCIKCLIKGVCTIACDDFNTHMCIDEIIPQVKVIRRNVIDEKSRTI